MKDIEVIFVDKIINTPCFKIAIEGHLYILEKGHTYNSTLITDNLKGIYAKYCNEVIGCLIFDNVEPNIVWLSLCYVKEEYRSKGIYKKLMNSLENWCVSNNFKYIEESTHVDNSSALISLKKSNFNPVHTIHRKKVF